jgi:imidazolonepropionase-like amidohydrolase
MSWVFEGTLLPEGDAGRVIIGTGERERLPGRWALVGLVDAHCHVTVAGASDGPYLDGAGVAERLHALAQTGVTTLRDVGGDRKVTLDLARSSPEGLPTVLAAGRFLAPSQRYFPRIHSPVEAEDLVPAVEQEIADGASWVKIIADFPLMDGSPPSRDAAAPTYPEDVLAEAIAAAHDAGGRVAAHTTTGFAKTLIDLGVDSIEHGLALGRHDLESLAARGGAWTPTLGASVGAMRRGDEDSRTEAAELSERFAELLPLAAELGVTVMTGSDVVSSVAEEIALLCEHGLDPSQALRAATTSAQTFLRYAPSQDLVTYGSDPRCDPQVLADPSAVVIRGVRVR